MVTMNSETSVKAFPGTPNSPPSLHQPLTNAVIEVLIRKGNSLKNFGQCIIFMLNRERTPLPSLLISGETSLQLLILKLLYLIFTTPETYEYFYNNDLRVLVDVFIRELYDLPDDAESVLLNKHQKTKYSYDILTSEFSIHYYHTPNFDHHHIINPNN
jgi:hypothetical protein